MDNSLPRWAVALGSDPALRSDFEEWAKDRVGMYSREGVLVSRDMGEVMGYRFMIGELEAMMGMVFWTVEENQRRQHAVSGLVEEEQPKRKRGRRKRNAE